MNLTTWTLEMPGKEFSALPDLVPKLACLLGLDEQRNWPFYRWLRRSCVGSRLCWHSWDGRDAWSVYGASQKYVAWESSLSVDLPDKTVAQLTTGWVCSCCNSCRKLWCVSWSLLTWPACLSLLRKAKMDLALENPEFGLWKSARIILWLSPWTQHGLHVSVLELPNATKSWLAAAWLCHICSIVIPQEFWQHRQRLGLGSKEHFF